MLPNARDSDLRRHRGRFLPVLVIVSLASVLGPARATGSSAAVASVPTEIRVNQVGYATGVSKRAFLMAPVSESGASFRVVSAEGSIAAGGRIGASQGPWSPSYPFVYAIDFDAVNDPGSYRIEVGGPRPASSPGFRVDTPAHLYTTPLANALDFFQNERDGRTIIPSALRTAPGHLNDRRAMTYLTPAVDGNGSFTGDLTALGVTIDASGGWWDAGDYLKFVETTSYTVAMLAIGARDFPDQLGADAGAASNFREELRFGLDFLQRMWDDATRTLYYQVGIGSGDVAGTILSDHDIWRLPQADDTLADPAKDVSAKYIRHRPVFRAGAPGSRISPNLAGRLAADMALCFQLYRTTAPAYARQCLVAGEHVFDLANTSPDPTQNLLTAIPFGFYPETEWRDDLELGATELARALTGVDRPDGLPHSDPAFYLQKAAHWAHQYITGPNDAVDTLNLYDVSALAHFDLDRAITAAGDPGGLEVSRAALVTDLKKQLDHGVAQSGQDPFGFGFPWDTFDTTTHGAGLVVTAAEYQELTGSTAYAQHRQVWLSNILGANAWGTSLIVGDGQVFPHCMQQQVVNLVGSHDGSPPILAGAAVEGPNSFAATGTVSGMKACPAGGSDRFAQFNRSTAVYRDNVESYSTVEPAIDLTASSPVAFAWQIDN